MPRKSGLVRSSLYGSRRINGLPDDSCRWAYVYLITCAHGNAIGYYSLRPAYMAADLGCDAAEAERRLAELVKAELILFDREECVVRVLRWWSPANGYGDIASHFNVIAASRAIGDTPRTWPYRLEIAADLIAAALVKCDEWSGRRGSAESSAKRLEVIESLISRMRAEYGKDALAEAFAALSPADLDRVRRYVGELIEGI